MTELKQTSQSFNSRLAVAVPICGFFVKFAVVTIVVETIVLLGYFSGAIASTSAFKLESFWSRVQAVNNGSIICATIMSIGVLAVFLARGVEQGNRALNV